MARRYRCTNCGAEFVGERPACVTCDIDPATDHRAVGVVQPIATIHFDPPHPKIRHRGLGHRACDPATHIGKGRGTAEPSVVNCEMCKETEAYKAAVKKGGLRVSFHEDDDEEITMPIGVKATGTGDCGCKGS